MYLLDMFLDTTEMASLSLSLWFSVQWNKPANQILKARMLRNYFCFVEYKYTKILTLLH